MTASTVTDNLELAAIAKSIADESPAGSLRLAAAGSVAVTCATTRDLAQARTTLEGITPAQVRDAALELLNELAGHAS